MAWTSDTIWCDPKIANIGDAAYRSYINANSYSSGFLLRGCLTAGQLKTIGCAPRVRGELIGVGLWHDDGAGGIRINDWDDHNGKRDDRREKDRVRKKEARRSARASAGQSAGASAGQNCVEGSEGSDGVTTTDKTSTAAASPPRLRVADPAWDFVVEIDGEPLPRYRAARGRIVADLKQLLDEQDVGEARRRHDALAREWGDAKATTRALVQNWDRAGRMADGLMRPAQQQPRADGRITASELYASARPEPEPEGRLELDAG